MREILFRGKRCNENEWAYGFYVKADRHWHERGVHKDWIVCGAISNGGWFNMQDKYAVKPETLGQYTGLKDKDGKWIFEGDVVRGIDRLNKGLKIYGYISHENGSFVIVGDFMTHYRWLDYEVEIIGNIHDNPELIGGEEDA